jgi:NodT family efflux transporter outer membrane factor (OMF) lipoprotein
MTSTRNVRLGCILLLCISVVGCIPELGKHAPDRTITATFGENDTTSIADVSWREFFRDTVLQHLVDSVLVHNQELAISSEELQITANEILARKGEILPQVRGVVGAGIDKPSRTTREGAVEESLEIVPGRENSVPLADFGLGAALSWEVDIWRRLRNAADAATARYIADTEARRALVTMVVAETATTYYELLATDRQISVVDSTIVLMDQALRIVELQKAAAKTTELAVQRFTAEVHAMRARRHLLSQQSVELQNRLNILLGKGPRPIMRDTSQWQRWRAESLAVGRPEKLLLTRPDIRQAEAAMIAANLDVDVARAAFFPSLGVRASAGLRSSDATLLVSGPESMAYAALADLVIPIVNRSGIEAAYRSAGARSNIAAYRYERSCVQAYNDVATAIASIENARKAYDERTAQVQALQSSVGIAGTLFQSARADYMEVLLTQRDALEARLEQVDMQLRQMTSSVALYRALGGGWK